MPYNQKAKRQRYKQQHSKQAQTNIAGAATDLNNAQDMGRYVKSRARGIIFKQYAKAGQTEQSDIEH